MLNKAYKLLAVILALSVLFSCLPMSIFAFDVPNESESLPDVNEAEAYSSDVIVEDESLREENVKHFRMPDGSYTAVSYNKPVHRMDANGVWQDIDNSMTEAPVKNKQAFVTADGRTVFSKKINSNDPTVFELSENGYSIKVSFANADIKNTTAKLSNHAKKYTPTNADDIETQYKKLKTIDNNTTVAYKNLLKGMTLEYVLSANDIKENIIVEKTNDSYAYTFIYELTGLTAVLNDDGSIVLLDETEQMPVYKIPAPYMYDANNATSDNVSYALSDLGNGTYELTVSADETWINSSERVFPVVIDPSIFLNIDAKDTYISSYAPNTNYGESEKLWVSSQETTFMNFGELPRISKHATIHYATLTLRYYYYIATGSLTVGLHQAINDWNEYSLTWNTANEQQYMGISPFVFDTAELFASSAYTESSPGRAMMDVTALVQAWYAGMPNYGMVIQYEGGTNSSVILTSRETYTYSYFEITYAVDPLPIENGVYFLKNKQVDGCVQIEDGISTNTTGAILELWKLDGDSDQKWVITYLHNGYYKILSAASAQAITAPDSKPESITLEYYQASTNQMWQITDMGNGYHTLSPASDSSGYMAVAEGIGSNGRNVKLRNAQSDNQDEWSICTPVDTSILLAIDDSDGWARDSYFSKTKTNLQTAKNRKVCLTSTVKYTSESVVSMIDYLKSSDIFIIHTHGSKTSFKISNTSPQSITMENIETVDLSNLSLVLLLTCSAGEDFDSNHIADETPVNIIEQMVICGADTVVGFDETTLVIDCNLFAEEFTGKLINDGLTVQEAIDDMSGLYIQNMKSMAKVAGDGQKKLR